MGKVRSTGGRTWMALAIVCFSMTGSALAQAATDQDKRFLEDTAQDSIYEIKTGQLALQKSPSADVKAYATMVIHDHTELMKQVKLADNDAEVKPPDSSRMSLSDDASYAKLKLLSGDSFDKSYIQGLIKGNEQSLEDGKAEVAATTVPAIKTLAKQRVTLGIKDTKHSKKAGQLAIAHHVPAGS